MTSPIYAIGDIHGQIEQLEQALALVEADGGPEAEIVFLGDYVDRGASSRAVIERLMEGAAAGRNWTVLRGNHDRMFCWFMEAFPREDPHLPIDLYYLEPRIGGRATLASYGVEIAERPRKWDVHAAARARVPASHLDFLAERPLWHRHGDLLFVHAGIRPGIDLEDQAEEDLVWIRAGFIDDTRVHPWLVVHGHTALDHPVHFGNRVDLDGGAGYGRPLVPAVFEGRDVWCLSPEGRVPLRPQA